MTPNPLPTVYPSARSAVAMVYDSDLNGVLLFGGGGHQDTWLWSGGHWTNLIADSACTSTACPSPRGYAMMAYDSADHEAVLFGGLGPAGIPFGLLGDTWTFYNGAWHNITSSLSTAPPARYDGSMTYDSGDGYVLLFGGGNKTGVPLGDTWTFHAGAWANITLSLSRTPEAREGASIADSPLGWVLLFGGLGTTSLIQNKYTSNIGPYLGWWFHNGSWSPMTTPIQPYVPVGASGSGDAFGPCGRYDAALAWSPQNNRFVLFGGSGVVGNGTRCGSAIFLFPLNDTWDYNLKPGGIWWNGTGSGWRNDTFAGGPSPRAAAGYASDYADNYFLLFGGSLGILGGYRDVGDTWRYFQRVHAVFAGPHTIQAGQIGFGLFLLEGFGGSGTYNYSSFTQKMLNSRALVGCPALTTSTALPMPTSGYVSCNPTTTSYNVFRTTVAVWDFANTSDSSFVSWTFTVQPPESIRVYSEYKGYFYQGLSVQNIFGVYAEVANAGPTSVSATIDSLQTTFLSFSAVNSSTLWWNSTPVDMGQVAPGTSIVVTAKWSDWNQTATIPVTVVQSPDWLQQLTALGSYFTSSVSPSGKGPFNKTYTASQTVPLDPGKWFNFSLPIPFAGGNFSLFPSLKMVFTENSNGSLSVSGALTLQPPSISFGPGDLTLSATLTITGTVVLVTQGPNVTGIQWDSASITLTITGDFKVSIPIWGFDINILGADVHVGFTLDIDVAPSVALSLLLTPTTVVADQFVQKLGLTVSQLLASFTLPLSVQLSFGIAIASVSIGGTLSVALGFTLAPTPALTGGWVNGSIQGTATFLCWSATWNVLGPGSIYAWKTGAVPAGGRGAATAMVGYNNGSSAVWSLAPRYYNTSGYDTLVWNPNATSGSAVSDVYPSAQVTSASAYNGAYLFYTDDRAGLPVERGLTIAGLRIDPASNRLTALPSPPLSGVIASGPRATTLPDGSIFVAWNAIPYSETGFGSPASLASVGLEGARFFPSNQSWGPVQTYTTGGFAESYSVDASSASQGLLALVSSQAIAGPKATERLIVFNLTTGSVISNVSASQLSRVVDYRVATARAIVQSADGTDSVVGLSSGAVTAVGYSPPVGWNLTLARFVDGSTSTVLLQYKSPSGRDLVVYDTASASVLATVPLSNDTNEVHGMLSGGTDYLFASTATSVLGWTLTARVVANLTSIPVPGPNQFGLAQAGSSIVLYAVDRSGGNASAPVRDIVLAEIPASLPMLPVPTGAKSTPGSGGSGSSPNYALYLGLGAAADAALLVMVAILVRLRPLPPSRSSGASPPPAADSVPPAKSPDGPGADGRS